jgi:MFS family permease
MKLSRLRRRWIRPLVRDPLIFPFYVPAFLVFLGFGFVSPVLPIYVESFDISYRWVGLVLSAQAFGMLISDLPNGLLLRRLGHKRAMLLGIGALVLARLAFSWAGSVPELIIYRLLSGFGMSLYGVARHAFVTGRAEVATRGRALALFGGLMRIGRFIGPVIGGYLAAALGFRFSFVVSSLVSALGVLFVVAFIPGLRSDDASAVDLTAHDSGVRLFPMLRRQLDLLVPAGVGQVFVQMVRSGRGTIIPLYAAGVIGMEVDQVGLMVGIAAAVEMMMFIPAGWLMDNMGRKYALVPSFAIQAVAMALVPLTHSFGALLACASLAGLGNGLSSGGMMTLGADLAPSKGRGEFLGVWRLIGDAGGTGGPAVVGWVADAFALPSAALAMGASGMMAALIFGFLLPETRQLDTEMVSAAS